MPDDRKIPANPYKLTEKQLVESGAFIRELDERVYFDKLTEKVDNLIGVIDRIGTRLDRVEEKFETRLTNVTDKVSANNSEFEHALNEMRVDVTRLEAQVKVLMDLKESNWINNFLKLVENKQVRAALLLGGGWVASMMGPDILKTLLKLFSG
jgi:hypothetical protein